MECPISPYNRVRVLNHRRVFGEENPKSERSESESKILGELGAGRPDFGGRWPRGEALGQKTKKGYGARYKPYDQRQCGLLDAAETFALTLRFTNFVMIAVLLLFDAKLEVAWGIGGAVLLFNVMFVCYMSRRALLFKN